MRRPLRSVPWVRPPAMYRPGRRVSPHRARGVWSWRPDSWIERADAWLWNHPKTQAFLAGLLLAVMILTCAYLAFCTPEVGP